MSTEIALAQLGQIAAAMRLVSGNVAALSVSFGVDDRLTHALRQLPGARWMTSLFSEPDEFAIDRAEVRVDGVLFSAQCGRRPMTLPERVQFERDARINASYKSMTVGL